MTHYVVHHTCSYSNTYVIMQLLILADSYSLPLFKNGVSGIERLCSPTCHLKTYFNEDIRKQNTILIGDNNSK